MKQATNDAPPIQTNSYMNEEEIQAHLEGVEYIIMASPSSRADAKAPIHFTIFLNTADTIPHDIQEQIFNKFVDELQVTAAYDIMSVLQKVGFARTNQDTPMPMHLFKEEDQKNIPHTMMHIMDFEGDAEGFENVKTQSQTGWSYAYESA